MFVGAVHGDDDLYRWNIVCVPAINEGTVVMDPVIRAAASSDILCAYCQRIGDQACIRRWCNRAFALTVADVASVPSAITPLESYYRRPIYPTPWRPIPICPPYSNYYILDSNLTPIL
ncbi:hypothetical protein ACJMK2_007870 [Sinanodonta woodiana]|uniref:Uncharacterized protein n=1 Tax=Sinanodonta woodiana TaxID=1069815 RepID=A0ABD3VKS2_SINWO